MNLKVLSTEFHNTNCLPFVFQTDGNFYQITLSQTLAEIQKSQIEKNQMSSEVKLLERTKVYYSFNSKRDNFNVNKL